MQKFQNELMLLPIEERDHVFRSIVEFVTKKSFTENFLTHFQLTQEQQKQAYDILYAYIHENKPLLYSFGITQFLDVTLAIKPPILIPRPETEEWVGRLIEHLEPFKHEQLHIVDVGTGSGCIVLSLAKKFPLFRCTAVDIADYALALAQENAAGNDIHNVRFVQSDLLEHVNQADIIISNPPYIAQAEYETLDASVKDWEDKGALVAADNGYAIIDRIIQQGLLKCSHAYPQLPQYIIEIGHNQGYAVQERYKEIFTHIDVKKDYCGKDRVVYFYK